MADDGKKGITVKIDAELHAEVRKYIEDHNMTMSEFISAAVDDTLHPKIQNMEGNKVGNMRTVAFQVPEELFQRIKDYLQRNNMTQRQFLLGLIEEELDREQTERESMAEAERGEDAEPEYEPDIDEMEESFNPEADEDSAVESEEIASNFVETDSEEADAELDESEDEETEFGMSMGM